MKLADIGNLTTFRSSGKVRKVGKWSFYDSCDYRRTVYHHGTEMGYFVNEHTHHHIDSWYFVPVSTGWGSASDQQGMNKIMPTAWRYRRNGGRARYEFNGVEYKF